MTTDANRLIAAVNEALRPATAYRDDSPLPRVGATPPVAQPGRPPMSQRATDISSLMLAAGLATVPPGLVAIGVLVASGYADPAVIGMICAIPAALAIPLLAVARLLRGAQGIVPAEQHHHYNGPVSQQHHNVSTQTRGLFAKTINKR
ncbi:hypothetical protein ACIPW5_11390 [Streptomyces sp. NPDC090077]|uniref:hypothetical protein n=1 Tax=Streptomyces sp. NPDC090077 TaxID=3365938 RepID=UPI00380835ED